MTMTDPIADMLTRVRNANSAGKPTVSMPSSKKLVEIARIMQEEGYVQGYDVIEGEPRATLEITLKYGDKKAKTIRGIKRISKPGLRIYAGKDELPRVLGGLGTAIVSTSNGVMTDRDARKKRRRRRSHRLHLVGKGGIDMSRIGKLPVTVPAGVEVTIDGTTVTAKGPEGRTDPHLPRHHDHQAARATTSSSSVRTTPAKRRAYHGLARTLISQHGGGRFCRLSPRSCSWWASATVPRSRARTLRCSLASPIPSLVRGSREHHVRGSQPDRDHRERHQQGAGRPGCREHPQVAQAGALQGQGHSL